MGLIFRKRVKIDGDTAVNVSNSGLSISKRIDRRLTLNSRGGGSFRIAPGLSWRFGRRRR
jgi:hypothetical protein